MKVSIITVCYNSEKTIRNTIESVLSQDYNDIEYIVIDGLSTDGTMAIVNEYKDRISIIKSEHDRCMYEALNKGLLLASGDIISWLHSDDTYFNDKVISNYVKAFKNTNCDIAFSNGLYIDNTKNKITRCWIGGSYRRWKIAMGWLPLHTTVFVIKNAQQEVGLYSESYKIAGDTDFLVRFLKRKNVKATYLPEYTIKMSVGGLSTNTLHRWQMFEEDIRVYQSNGYYCTYLIKLMKMAWKIPQFIRARFANIV